MTIINMSGGKPAKPIVVEAVEDTPSTLPHTYVPREGVDYLSSVTVGKDPNLVPENVKKDVSIFGTVGTLESGGIGISKDTYISPNSNWSISIYLSYNDPSIFSETAELPTSAKYRDITNKCAVGYNTLLSSVVEYDAPASYLDGTSYHHEAEDDVFIDSDSNSNPGVGESGVNATNIAYALNGGNSTLRRDTQIHCYCRIATSYSSVMVDASDDTVVELTLTPKSTAVNPILTVEIPHLPEFTVYGSAQGTTRSIMLEPFFAEVTS